MGKKHLLRFGLASMLAGSVGLGGVLAACGDDEGSSSGGTNTPDTGPGSETGTPDTGGGDTGTPDTGVDAGPPLAKLTLVNAAHDLGQTKAGMNAVNTQAIRICFKSGTNDQNLSVAPYPPLPREAPAGTPAGTPPGLYNNTGGAFPSFGIDLEGRILQPIIMNARSLATKGYIKPTDGGVEKVCDELLDKTKTTDLAENTDYWVLDPIPAGTFKKDKSFLLVLTGCAGDAQQTPGGICGADFNGGGEGKGNLKVQIAELTRTPVNANQQGVQVAHMSAQYDSVTLGQRPFTPGFTADPTSADAGAYRNASAGPVALYKASPAQAIAVTDDDFFAAHPDEFPPDLVNPSVLAPFPLPAIQAFSGLGTNAKPTVYVKGKNYVFVSVGDPGPTTSTYVTPAGQPANDPTGNAFNIRKFHYLAFPTDPAVQMYKP